MVTRFKAYCFELILRHSVLVRSPTGENFRPAYSIGVGRNRTVGPEGRRKERRKGRGSIQRKYRWRKKYKQVGEDIVETHEIRSERHGNQDLEKKGAG